MDRYRTSGIAGLLAATTLITVGLHALGGVPGFAVDWQSPLTWINASAPADVMGAGFRYAGLAIGYWVLITTVLYYALSLVRAEHRPHWISLVTLPPIRRLIDGTLAASLAISVLAAPVASLRAEPAQPTPPPIVFATSPDGIPVPHIGPAMNNHEPTPVAEQTPAVTPQLDTPPEQPVAPPTSEARPTDAVQPAVIANLPAVAAAVTGPATDSTYTVERGDNLWTIAASRLRTVLGDKPTSAQIDDYWRTVIAANRDTLRSGDPNLIYPGEMILLPIAGLQP